MKVLVLGGDGRVASRLIDRMEGYEVFRTTRREVKDEKQIFLDLSDTSCGFLGEYDVVIVCACDFKKGRPDGEQALAWEANVNGVKRAVSMISFEKIIFLSSYLSTTDTAYGRQKKAIEDWIIEKGWPHSILRIGRIGEDYEEVIEKIMDCIKYPIEGMVQVL